MNNIKQSGLFHSKVVALLNRVGYKIANFMGLVGNCFGWAFFCLYVAYCWSLFESIIVDINTTGLILAQKSLLALDIPGAFYAFNSALQLVSLVTLGFGLLWGNLKLFHYSVVKIQESQNLSLAERISLLENEQEGTDEDDSGSSDKAA